MPHHHVFHLSEACNTIGVRHAVICPGSRSAPLVRAFGSNNNFKTFSVVDERSAAYMALGMARELQKPVVLICTSGTAALNFYPAIAEAFYQKVPLLILTADRPAELLNQQDGQMLNQQLLYGSHVRSYLSFTSETSINEVQYVLQKALHPVFGPVHLNIPLEEPLYDLPVLEMKAARPDSISLQAKLTGTEEYDFPDIMNKKTILLAGHGFPDSVLADHLKSEVASKNIVLLADVSSNLHECSEFRHFDFVLSHASDEMLKELEPDVLISFGGPVLSKALKLWLKKQKPAEHIRIQKDTEWKVNTYGNVTRFVVTDEVRWIKTFIRTVSEKANEDYMCLWKGFEKRAKNAISDFLNKPEMSEPGIVNTLLNHLPEASQLHIANSSVIRYVSYLGIPEGGIKIYSNRGVSGIDGCTSSALGASLVAAEPVTLLTGDLAFFYDRNAFWNTCLPDNLRIVILNNGGGGIFGLIDGPASQPGFEKFFITPHGLTAKNLAQEFGLDYYFCNDLEEMKKQLNIFYRPTTKPKIMEIKSDRKINSELFADFKRIKLL